jgi:SH3-like domain-containing protein
MHRGNVLRIALAALLACGALAASPVLPDTAAAHAQDTRRGPSTGLPLPRFVSLKSSRVNLRIGPGLNYAVDWMYLKSGVPVEVVQEYDNWRRIRDSDGTEGWVNQSLLSGTRTAVAAPWQRGRSTTVPLRREPSSSARTIANVEPGAQGRITMCNGQWCEVDFAGHRGWMEQSQLWGAYPGETYKD